MASNDSNNDDDDGVQEQDEIDTNVFAGVDIDGAAVENVDIGWDDADGEGFDGDVRELAREWIAAEIDGDEYESVQYTDAGLTVETTGCGSVSVDVEDDEDEDVVVTFGTWKEPVTVGDMRFDLRPDGRGFGGSEAVNVSELFRAFDAFPATEQELVSELKTADGVWADARRMYDTASRARDTPSIEDARSKVIEALEIEYEWMYVTDRSNEDYYDLRCWTPSYGWREDAYQVVEQRMSEELGTRSTKAETNHVIHHLANRNPVRSEQLDGGDDPRTLIAFENGVLHLESVELDDDGHYVEGSGELLDHDPEFRFQTRVEVEWDPDAAEFDVIDEFMTDIIGGRDLTPTTKETDIKTLWEFAGHSFFTRYSPQGFLMIIGEGGDGKTVWFNLVTEVLGEENVSGATLEAITSDKFSAAEVVNRKANIAADIGGTIQTDISDLKWMTGDDRSQIRPIRKAPFFDRNGATMMFGSNSPPAFAEKKRSLKRRLYPVRAPFEFHGDPDEDDPTQKQKRQKSELMAELTADEALAAVAVRMVEGARRLQLQDEWTLGLEMDEQERLEFYEEEADAVADFTRSCIEPDAGGEVALDDLKAAYDAYAVEHDHPSKPRNTIKNEIERSRDIQLNRAYRRSWTEEDGERVTTYKGVAFTSEAKKYLPPTAFWSQYDLENPHTGGDDESESVEFTDVEALDPGRHDVRATVENVREDPAPWLHDQGVVGDGTDVIRYEIPEGEELEEGATYHLFDAVVQPDDADLKLQIVPGMTDVRFIEDGTRDDDQEPADPAVSESNGEPIERPVQVQDGGEVLAVFTRNEAEDVRRGADKPAATVAADIGRKPTDDTLKAIRMIQNDAEDGEPEIPEVSANDAQRDRVQSVKDVVKSVEGGEPAAVEEVLDRLEDNGITREKAEKELEKLKHRGDVYEPADGRVRTT